MMEPVCKQAIQSGWMVKSLWARMMLASAVLGVCSATGSAQPMQTVTLPDAIAIMEVLESRVHDAEWNAEYSLGTYKDVQNLKSYTEKEKTQRRCLVRFAPTTGKYFVDREDVMPWVNGPDSHLTVASRFSFDGMTEREFQTQQPGKSASGYSRAGSGFVRRERLGVFVGKWGIDTGIAFFTPNCFGVTLSEFLREKMRNNQQVSITVEPAGDWTFSTIDARMQSTLKVTYDPRRGAIRQCSWIANDNARRTQWVGKEWRRITIELSATPDAPAYPVAIHDVNYLDSTGSRTRFANVKVNQGYGDAQFRISFPKGTEIVDEVERKRYTVSDGVIDEASAIRDFVEYEQLHAARDNESPRSRWVWVALLSIACLLVTLAIWRRIRLRSAARPR